MEEAGCNAHKGSNQAEGKVAAGTRDRKGIRRKEGKKERIMGRQGKASMLSAEGGEEGDLGPFCSSIAIILSLIDRSRLNRKTPSLQLRHTHAPTKLAFPATGIIHYWQLALRFC